MDLEQSHLLPLGAQVVHHLFGGLAGGAHHDHDPLRVLRAVVVEDMVVSSCDPVDALHVLLHHGGDGVIGAVVGLLGLVVHIRALHGGALEGVLRVHGDPVVGLQGLPVHEARHGVQIDYLDLLDLVGGSEAVEEVEEGNPALDGGQMGHGGQVHDLLDAGGGHHCDAGGAAAHDILVVAEDVVGVLGHGAGGHVEYGRHPVAGHDVQIGDH